MSKVLVKTQLISDGNPLYFEGKGIFDEEQQALKFKDQEAIITLMLQDNILIRETSEAILSYKFRMDESSRFEIIIKDLKQTGSIGITTKHIEKNRQSFEVKYQLDGNQFVHHYLVTWREI